MSEQAKTLVPKLRFPEFLSHKPWDSKKLEDLIDTVSPPQKLQTSQYQTAGKYPIFDQSQTYICGWTDNTDALVKDNLPLIIFGDHTCALKIANEPFAQGADGIKILQTKNEVETQFLYQSLQNKPLVMEEYKRHFSTLKERIVCYPDIDTGEQQKIAGCLSSLDDLIAAQNQKIEALKQHKKGLMLQLFPAEGETVPKLRFPEFENDGEWKKKILKDIAEISSGSTPLRSNEEFFVNGSIHWVKTTDLNNSFIVETEEKITPQARARINPVGSVLVAMYGGFNQIGRTGCLSVPAATNQAISVLVINNKAAALSVYVLAWLNAKVEEWKRIASSSRKDPNITGSDVGNFPISLPKPLEQQRITDCISSLDNLIATQTQKLEAYKTYKKGLMQQLFPSLEEIA